MTTDGTQVLTDVLNRLGLAGKPLLLGFDEVQHWPSGILYLLEQSGLLVKDIQAKSIECVGCEHACSMLVDLTEDCLRAFVVCDHPERQDYMGRIAVDLTRLNQWQISTKHVADVIAKLLGTESKPLYQKDSNSYHLGMFKGKKGRRAATLTISPLAVVINGHSLTVSELLYIEAGELCIDTLSIGNATDTKAAATYTPDTSRQEARKLKTQAMYQDWKDSYSALLNKYSGKSDVWYSMQIAKLPIAQGRSADTIRKHMKD